MAKPSNSTGVCAKNDSEMFDIDIVYFKLVNLELLSRNGKFELDTWKKMLIVLIRILMFWVGGRIMLHNILPWQKCTCLLNNSYVNRCVRICV